MYKKCVFLLIAILVCSMNIFSVSAATITKTKTFTNLGGYARGFVQIVATTTTTRYKPITSTQCEHTGSAQTTISVSKSVTKTLTASSTFTGTYKSPLTECQASCGLSASESVTVGTSVSYTISKSTAAGLYRITTVYPCMSEKATVVGYYTASASTTVQSKTISYAPKTDCAYYKLEKYASL